MVKKRRPPVTSPRTDAQFQLAFEAAPSGMMIVDDVGNILLVNGEVEHLFGYRRDELVGRPVHMLVPARVRAAHAGHHAGFAKDPHARGLGSGRELSGVHKDGREVPVEIGLTPIEIDGSSFVLASVLDISARRRAEGEVRARERQLQMVVEAVNDIVFEFDGEGRCLSVWAADETKLARPKVELLGRRVADVIGEAAARPFLARFRAVLETGVPEAFEYSMPVIDGLHYFSAKVKRLPGAGGISATLVMGIADVTERKRVEVALEDSEMRFRQMAEYIKEAFFIVDLASGRPLYVSPTWSEIWGRPIEQGSDPRVWFEAVHPDDRAALSADQAAVAAGQATTTTFRVVRPDGAIRWVRGRAFPVRDVAGKVYRMAGVSEDITELRRVEGQMAQAQKMEAVGRLAGGVAHDFNNLLTVILSEAGMAQLEATDLVVKESLAEIRKAGERAATLTRQLLMFSRHQVVEFSTFKLNDVVADVDKMLRRLIGEDITIETFLAPDAGLIKGDRGQIEQVLANLVVNARDAMPDGGRLIIEAARFESTEPRQEATGVLPSGRYALLTITDSGMGMGAETLSHIFEPFFTTKEAGKGTGLGLSTVYGIVGQCGGQIGVYSELGRGTTFRVYLPAVEGEPTEARVTPAGEVIRGTETVLLVEDEGAVRRVAKASLERWGYRVLEAGDPAEAMGMADAFKGEIHILVTDVVMPGMGGQDLVARVSPLRPQMKILFTSGYTERSVGLPGASGRAPAFIQKPFTPQELLRKVRRVLDD